MCAIRNEPSNLENKKHGKKENLCATCHTVMTKLMKIKSFEILNAIIPSVASIDDQAVKL